MKLYKILGKNGEPINGGSGYWHLPKGKRPGKWMPAILNIQPCVYGYHLVEAKDIAGWLSGRAFAVYELEYRGSKIVQTDKVVVSQVRLVSRVGKTCDRSLRLFACACAEHVLPIFEQRYPADSRPRDAIRVASKFAKGRATSKELATAESAAAVASWEGAGAMPAWTATWASAWVAAREAARDAVAAAWAAAVAAAAPATAAKTAELKWQGRAMLRILRKHGND